MFEQFPYANFHEINLDWIIQKLKDLEAGTGLVLSVNGQTGNVVLYESPTTQLPDVSTGEWTFYRLTGVDGIRRGIGFDNNAKLLHLEGENAYPVYDTANPPPYPVTSVNGETGNVILYTANYTPLPAVPETFWNVTRSVDGQSEGIQFIKGQPMQRISDINRYNIYDSGNPPPYPVTSVNGQTGAVTITIPVTSVNGQTGAVTINIPVTSVNGQTGDVTITPPVSSVNGQTGAVVTPFINPASDILYLDSDSTGDYWGISRWINSNSQVQTEKGSASLYIEKSANSNVKAYISFLSEDETVSQTYQLLTTNDIPSGSGVLSINGQTGVVTLYGNNMPISNANSTSVKTYVDNNIATLNSDITTVQNAIAYIVGDTNTTGSTLAVGAFVYVKGHATIPEGLREVTASISADGAITTNNTQSCTEGGINALNSKISQIQVVRSRQISGVTNSVGFINYTGTDLFAVKSATGNYLTYLLPNKLIMFKEYDTLNSVVNTSVTVTGFYLDTIS